MKTKAYLLIIMFLLSGCIEQDIINDLISEEIDIIVPPGSLHRGLTYDLESQYTDNTGMFRDTAVVWSTSDPLVAEIDSEGRLSTLDDGEVTITVRLASNPELSTDLEVTIWPNPKVTNLITSISIGSQYSFEALYINEEGEELSGGLVWSTESNMIISLTPTGELEALALGKAILTVSKPGTGFTEDIEIEVIKANPGIEVINPPMNNLVIGETYEVNAVYRNELLEIIASEELSWASSNESVATVDQNGRITTNAVGQAEISVSQKSDPSVVSSFDISVACGPAVRCGTIKTTSFYDLEGTFTIKDNPDGDGVVITIADDYIADSSIPGLYVYLTNNPSTVNGALEIEAVTVFSGAHQYIVNDPSVSLGTYDYLLYFCKPFNVKVGDGQIN